MKRNVLVMTLLALVCAGQALSVTTPEPQDLTTLRLLAIQQGGRIKPLDTFARESVRAVTGKERFEGRDPVATMLSWWAHPEEALGEQNIEIRNLALKKELNLEAERRWFSYQELAENAALETHRDTLHEKMRNEEELDGTEQELQEVFLKMHVLTGITSGEAWTVVPNPAGLESPWASLAELSHPDLTEAARAVATTVEQVRSQAAGGDADLGSALETLAQQLRAFGPYPEASELWREAHFNSFHPFRKAWVLYLTGFLLLLFAGAGRPGALYWTGLAVTAFGFAMHAYGFYLRCMIAGRPPVTNMYESVIWVAFGAVFFALIFEYLYRSRSYLMAATAGAVVCLILADTLPAVLDPSIRPLTPVLRSNFWLTIHVLTITLGYAAFLLALGLGHMVLWKYVTGSDQKEQLKSLNLALYRSMQVGVLLLAAGTILGGVWANYSWGRFWGWDPKEVWALIALLGYLAILHGRYAGWLREFGMAAWSIVAFQGVLMAWYGVNFVLGAGLHSYGFGNGGVKYVAIYVAVELLFVALMAARYKKKQRPA